MHLASISCDKLPADESCIKVKREPLRPFSAYSYTRGK